MSIDIRARYILGELRKTSPQAILAGGAVRDTYFGVEPKDYDFFVPTKAFKAVTGSLMAKYGKGSFSDKKYAYARNSYLKGVYDTKIEGCDVQIMSSDFEGNDDFALNVVNTFDFGINRIYYDGGGILRDTEDFQKDDSQNTMTLYTLNDIKYLPKYLDRFQRINAKYKNRFTFKSPCIMIVDPVSREEVKDIPKSKSPVYSSSLINHYANEQLERNRQMMQALGNIVRAQAQAGGDIAVPNVDIGRMGVAMGEVQNRRPPALPIEPAPEGWLREVAEEDWNVNPAAEIDIRPRGARLNPIDFFNGNN